MFDLVTANSGLFAGLGLYIGTAAVILFWRDGDAHGGGDDEDR